MELWVLLLLLGDKTDQLGFFEILVIGQILGFRLAAHRIQLWRYVLLGGC